MTGCGASSNISDETQTESEAPVDDNYGKGLSFTYTDYADNVLSLSYTLKRNANNQWQLSISGQNAHFNGTKIITDNKADTFFYYLVNETNIASYKDYNKTDDEITTDTAWWFNLNIYYTLFLPEFQAWILCTFYQFRKKIFPLSCASPVQNMPVQEGTPKALHKSRFYETKGF